jgi:hypothetical protein
VLAQDWKTRFGANEGAHAKAGGESGPQAKGYFVKPAAAGPSIEKAARGVSSGVALGFLRRPKAMIPAMAMPPRCGQAMWVAPARLRAR